MRGLKLFQTSWWFAVVPLVFIVYTWLISDGLPYHTDANESFSAYVQARNMVRFDPTANAFLPDDANASHVGAHPFTYTHGPNGPRYVSYVLLLAGLQSMSWHILLAALTSLVVSIWFIRRAFREVILPVSSVASPIAFGGILVALFCLDFLGVLQFIVNLWRTWHFPLFWGCVWAVRCRPHPMITFGLYFLLVQLEFLYALFTVVGCFGYLFWLERNEAGHWFSRTKLALLAGSAGSVGVFGVQLVMFYGVSGILHDAGTTYLARNTNAVEWEAIRQFYEDHDIMMWASSPNWDFRYGTYLAVTLEQLVRRVTLPVAVVVLGSGALSFALAMWAAISRCNPRAQEGNRVNALIGPLLWAFVASYLLLGLVLPGYTLNGYVYRWAPLLVFPVHLALALLIANLTQLLTLGRQVVSLPAAYGRSLNYTVLPIGALPVLGLWVLATIQNAEKHPPFIHSPAESLATTYRGRSFVSQTTFPHMIAHYTDRWAYYSPFVFGGDKRLDQSNNWNADRNRNPEYETPEFYLCEQLPYYPDLNCDEVARQMSALGHTSVERGDNYVIMKLNWTLGPGR